MSVKKSSRSNNNESSDDGKSSSKLSKNPFSSSHKSQEESRGAPEALSIIMTSWPGEKESQKPCLKSPTRTVRERGPVAEERGERESQKPCIKSSTRTVRQRGPKACCFSCVLCRSATPLAIRLAYLVRYWGWEVWRSAISSSSSVRGRPLRFLARYPRFWAATRSGCLAR